jgi:lipopolysaccharide heptosyltransferase II
VKSSFKASLRTLILLLVRLLGWPGAHRVVQQRQPTHALRILLIRPDHLGDLLMTTPILAAIRVRAPHAQITMMVGPWSREIVERHPAVDQLVSCPFPGFQRAAQKPLAPYILLWQTARQLRRQGYDLAINLRPDFWWGAALIYLAGIPRRVGYAIQPGTPFLTHALPFTPCLHSTVYNLRLASAGLEALGYSPLDEPYTPARYPLVFTPTANEQAQITERLAQIDITTSTPFVVIHPGTGGAVKLWRSEGWATIADELATTHNLSIILTGSPQERSLLEEIARQMKNTPVMLNDITVGQLAALFSRARMVLGVDNGPLHLAAALDRPTLALFGPTDAHIFGPWGTPTRHIVITSTYRCPTCPAIPCGRLDFTPDELPSHPCVKRITEHEVMDAVHQLLALSSTPSSPG